MTNKRWNYCGDMNLECGGFYWQESGYDDDVYCVEVIPASEMGGPDNLFLIQYDASIYLGNPDTINRALECCGWVEDSAKATRAQIVEAVRAYQGADDRSIDWVAIGKVEESGTYCGFSMPEIDVQLRGNASLARFVRREYLGLSR